MVLRFRKKRGKKKKDDAETPRAQREVEKRTANGSTVVVDEVGGVRGGDIARDRYAGGVLAGVYELARKILARIAGGAATCTAGARARILRVRGDGPGRAAGKAGDRPLRPRTGVHVRGTDSGVSAVQFSVRGAALTQESVRRT